MSTKKEPLRVPKTITIEHELHAAAAKLAEETGEDRKSVCLKSKISKTFKQSAAASDGGEN
jgi:hypothetical protein